ncbi:MAG: hypothetical protein AAFW46_15965 [Pseudomonadota bacterium]
MDYPNRRRVKIWGRARVVEDLEENAALLARLQDPSYRGRPEHVLLFEIDAWDVNCPQHITARYDDATVAKVTEGLQEKLKAALEENARLQAKVAELTQG